MGIALGLELIGARLGGFNPTKASGLAVGALVGARVFAAAVAATEVYVEPPTKTATASSSISAAMASAISMVTLVMSTNVMTAMMEPPLGMQSILLEHPPLQKVVDMLSRTSMTRETVAWQNSSRSVGV